MNAKKIVILIIITASSLFLWGICLYNGWLKEAAVFGYNIYNGILNGGRIAISSDENVTKIKYGEFAYGLLTDVIIPDNITTIEENAFKGNKLESITIGKDVFLDKNSFGDGFENVYNGNNKEAGTFTRYSHRSTEWFIWDGDFRYKNVNGNITITGYKGYRELVIPDEIHGNPVTIIGDYAFRHKNLTSVIIPNSVIRIEREAFRENQISTLTIGAGVTSIEDNAFDENFLSSVIIPNNVTYIGNEAFCCNQISSLTIGNKVTNIGNGAFGAGARGSGELKSIFLPNSVTNIGVNAFNKHPLTRVSIGANVTLGSNTNNHGVLGEATGFNTAYSNHNRRSGIYTRPNAQSGQWSRTAR